MNEKIDKNMNRDQTNSRVSYELLVILLIKYFIPSEIFLIVAFCYMIFLIFVRNHGSLIIHTETSAIYLIIILLIGTGIGLINIQEYGIREVIRDIFYILNPIIFIKLGVYIQKTWRAKYDIYKTIIILAVILSIISIFSLVSNIEIIKDANSVGTIRSDMGLVDISVILALVLLLTETQRGVKYFRKGIKIFFIIICTIPLVASFSRTNLVCFLALLIPLLMGKTKNSHSSMMKKLSTFICTMVVFGAIYKCIPSAFINEFSTKLMRSFTELSSNSNWNDTFNIVYNWRGYEISCAKKVFLTGNIFNMFLGYGYGKGIDVGQYAYLVDPGANTTIPVLHNGYYTMLIKNGIVGVILYLMFYFANIKTAIRFIKNKWNVYESKVYLGILFSLIFMTYFVTGIVSKNCNFVMCLLIGYISSNGPIDKNEKFYYPKTK